MSCMQVSRNPSAAAAAATSAVDPRNGSSSLAAAAAAGAVTPFQNSIVEKLFTEKLEEIANSDVWKKIYPEYLKLKASFNVKYDKTGPFKKACDEVILPIQAKIDELTAKRKELVEKLTLKSSQLNDHTNKSTLVLESLKNLFGNDAQLPDDQLQKIASAKQKLETERDAIQTEVDAIDTQIQFQQSTLAEKTAYFEKETKEQEAKLKNVENQLSSTNCNAYRFGLLLLCKTHNPLACCRPDLKIKWSNLCTMLLAAAYGKLKTEFDQSVLLSSKHTITEITEVIKKHNAAIENLNGLLQRSTDQITQSEREISELKEKLAGEAKNTFVTGAAAAAEVWFDSQLNQTMDLKSASQVLLQAEKNNLKAATACVRHIRIKNMQHKSLVGSKEEHEKNLKQEKEALQLKQEELKELSLAKTSDQIAQMKKDMGLLTKAIFTLNPSWHQQQLKFSVIAAAAAAPAVASSNLSSSASASSSNAQGAKRKNNNVEEADAKSVAAATAAGGGGSNSTTASAANNKLYALTLAAAIAASEALQEQSSSAAAAAGGGNVSSNGPQRKKVRIIASQTIAPPAVEHPQRKLFLTDEEAPEAK